MQKASDVKDDDSKISEFTPALKPLPESNIVNTARSIGTKVKPLTFHRLQSFRLLKPLKLIKAIFIED